MHLKNFIGSRAARATLAASAALALGVTVSACGSDSGSSSSGDSTASGTVSVVGYSTPTDAYEKTLEPAFQKTPEGADVDFSNSFGASGDQSRAVEAGQPADFVHFALAPDVDRLVDAGLVDDDWDSGKYERQHPGLGRRVHRPRWQPEEHPGLGRPPPRAT